MNYEIRKLKETELDQALILTWDMFLKYNAPFSEYEGIKFFKDHITYPKMLKRLCDKRCLFIGAFNKDKLIGFVMGTSNYIDLFFVNDDYQKQGVGKKMFEYYSKQFPNNDIVLSAAHYSIKFYKKIGFIENGEEKMERGILSIPLIYKRKNI